MVDNCFHSLLTGRGRPGKSTGDGSPTPYLEDIKHLVDLSNLPKSCPRSAQNHTVYDEPRLLSARASVSLSALCLSGMGNSLGIFILLSCLRSDSLNQDKGPVLLDLIQKAVAVSRSYQSNVTAKKQDRVPSVLETRGDQKSDENMSVPLGENKGFIYTVYCLGTSLHCSCSAEAKPQGCRFTRNALSSSWLHESE